MDAAIKVARLCFRAAMMTAISFILRVMLASAIVGTLMAPSFYSMIQTLKEKLRGETTKPRPTDFAN